MRNIVLYKLVFLLLIASNATSQKPFIDLLPSDYGPKHQNTVADTGFAGDSLVMMTPVRVQADSLAPGSSRLHEPSKAVSEGDSHRTALVRGSILARFFFSIARSNRFLNFYITALNKMTYEY